MQHVGQVNRVYTLCTLLRGGCRRTESMRTIAILLGITEGVHQQAPSTEEIISMAVTMSKW